jgi:hypothetical protein
MGVFDGCRLRNNAGSKGLEKVTWRVVVEPVKMFQDLFSPENRAGGELAGGRLFLRLQN